jgi:hypothetical protein
MGARALRRAVSDLKVWVQEASKDEGLSANDLAVLQAAMSIVERVTYSEIDTKPDTAN